MKVFNKICNIISTLIIIVLLALALILIVPRLLGQKTFAVLSGSMEPEIPVGAIVMTEEVDPAEIEAGQIITYSIGGTTMVTHRVTENNKAEKYLITKGDANDVEDGSPVTYDQVVGHVRAYLPFVGYISIYIKTPLGIAVIAGIVFVLILVNFLPGILSGDDEKKEKDKKEEKNTEEK